MEIILLVFILFTLAFLMYSIKNNKSGSSNELIVQLTNNLSNEIQNIRKEVGENSEKNRVEIENKLLSINKQLIDFHKSSKEDIKKQFSESNKVIKDVTEQLGNIRGTNEIVD